jgi:hypothetical protein
MKIHKLRMIPGHPSPETICGTLVLTTALTIAVIKAFVETGFVPVTSVTMEKTAATLVVPVRAAIMMSTQTIRYVFTLVKQDIRTQTTIYTYKM